jgi:hypothetical protein
MASFLERIGCLFGRHAPSRREVRYAGHLKVGPCRMCGRELEKRPNGRWVGRKGGRRGATGRAPLPED